MHKAVAGTFESHIRMGVMARVFIATHGSRVSSKRLVNVATLGWYYGLIQPTSGM